MVNTGVGYIPTPPGEFVKRELDLRGITQYQLADQMNMSYAVLNDILNGRHVFTTTTALLIEAAIDLPADSLLRMQVKYNLQMAKQDQTLLKRLAAVRSLAAENL
jgi:addiction module HigA family antidote